MRRSSLVMALLCALAFAIAGCNKAVATAILNNPVGPSAVRACGDGRDNDGDRLIDRADPGCHRDGNPNNNASYDEFDDNEQDDPTSSSGGPGPFNIDRNSIQCQRADFGEFRVSFNWSGSAGASSYRVERRGGVNSRGTWDVQNADQFTSFNGNSFLQIRVRPDFSYDYRVWAVNGAGQQLGNPEEFHACDAVFIPPPVVVTPPSGGPTPPGSTPNPGGGTTNPPPDGGACSGASASIPGGTYSKSAGSVAITYSVPAGCQWIFTSTNTHVVSVNPDNGTGPGANPRAFFLNVGPASVCFFGACSIFNITP